MATDSEISAAWAEAARHLDIRVFAPWRLTVPDGEIEVEAFLPDFGSPHGIVAISMEDDPRGKKAAGAGPSVSLLGSDYRRFEETLFRETLDDWGWFGPEAERPGWYTGRPWS